MINFHLAGFIPVSLIDYSGLISSVGFTHGCNLLCRYCHNPELVNRPKGENKLEEFLAGLEGKDIEGVAVTGGEPLIAEGIENFLKLLKDIGLKVKLDTNGSLPSKLRRICEAGLIDFAAVDIKAFNDGDMSFITRTSYKLEKLYETISIFREFNVMFEVRHTLWKVPDESDVGNVMSEIGDSEFSVQIPVRKGKWLDKRFNADMSADDIERAVEMFRPYGARFRNLNE